MRRNFKIAAVITATTLGAGMFAMPYVFLQSGWLTGVFYLVVLSGVVVWAHALYWRTLGAVQGRERLLGLAKSHLGRIGYCVGFASIVIGLILVLVIYLILGSQFIMLFWPGVNPTVGLLGFWLVSVLPLLFKEKRILGFEYASVFLMSAVIFLIFLSALPGDGRLEAPVFNIENAFLPFGVILFSLAGWTAIEPLYRESSGSGTGHKAPLGALAWGIVAVALLYILFVWGIFNSAPEVVPDTVSGLSGWPLWKLVSLGALGLFAFWTSYMPIGLEIKNALEEDLRWGRLLSLSVVVFVPLVLIFAGLSNFLRVIGLAGGVFLAMQYVLIALVGRKVLNLGAREKVSVGLLVAVFAFAAIYEFYYFTTANGG